MGAGYEYELVGAGAGGDPACPQLLAGRMRLQELQLLHDLSLTTVLWPDQPMLPSSDDMHHVAGTS